MFGIDDIILFPMAGAALGALTKKKNPLEGALLGGAMGLGGAALPGLLNPATAGALEVPAGASVNGALLEGGMSVPAAGSSVGGMSAAGGMSVAPGANVVAGAIPESNGLLAGISGVAKPAMQAVGTAAQAKSLMATPKMPAPPPLTPMPNSNLGNIVSGQMQQQQNQMQLDQQARLARRQQLRGLL